MKKHNLKKFIHYFVLLFYCTFPYNSQAQTQQPSQSLELGGVENTGMSQGSGRITTRNDVHMSVESLPGTSSTRLGAIGEAVGTQMTAIRQCYVDVTERRPITIGTLRFNIRILQNSSTARIFLADNNTNDNRLTFCVLRALRAASFSNIRGPAGGIIVIEFSNTAAEGAAIVQSEQAHAIHKVKMVNGHPEATIKTLQDEVTLHIRGRGRTKADNVAALMQNVQARVGTLLDCRRRASRKGQDPSGEIVISLMVPPRGFPVGRKISDTLEDNSAPFCVVNRLVRAGRGRDGMGSYKVTVRFAP